MCPTIVEQNKKNMNSLMCLIKMAGNGKGLAEARDLALLKMTNDLQMT